MNADDTIAAISSAAGPAVRMIVRLSGRDAHTIARAIADANAEVVCAAALRARLRFAGLSIASWVYVFKGPRSYTGDDLVEFHLPGNPLIVRMLMEELVARGARPAEPGEFTARAYFNGRMDLTQAEGVAAVVCAHGEEELSAARQLLAGELARRLRPAMERIAETLALVEVGIDFSEEDITFLSAEEVKSRAGEVAAELRRLLDESPRFERLSHEPRVVLVGRPNAGKSTLLNALAGWDRAVVSPVAGTTRDVVSAEVVLRDRIVTVMDAAGLDEAAPAGEDRSPEAQIARQMHERALGAVEAADVVVLVQDATDVRPRVVPPRSADVVVLTKRDLVEQRAGSHDVTGPLPPHPALSPEYRGEGMEGEGADERALVISARTGEGMEALRRRLNELAFSKSTVSSGLALNVRHRQSIEVACEALDRARGVAGSAGPEVVALELREALDALGQVIGQVTPDDVLGRVFATFCIGK